MSLVKFTSPSGWDFDQPAVTQVKMGSRGLLGQDRANFLKYASDDFLAAFERVKFAADEVPVHLIALGASEAYGPNRNGDGFKEATCRKYHPTFVKCAKFYRNHKNKADRGDPFYGIVKASAYNEKMRRVELLCALNAEKSAADRNGGFAAEDELQKLASNGDFPVSMACSVPRDVCSYCSNSARTRKDYCTHEKCAAGGCRSKLSQLVKVGGDLHHLHVDNPDPTWFDISRVFRPADRIAYAAKADYLTKAASANDLFDMQSYIKMADSATAPLSVILYQNGQHGEWSEEQTAKVKLAYALASMEESLGDEATYRMLPSTPFPVEKLASYGSAKSQTQLAALADRQVVLSFSDFAKWSGRESSVKSAAALLPTAYSQLLDDESIVRRVENDDYNLSSKVASSSDRLLAASVLDSHSLEYSRAYDRGVLSSVRGFAAGSHGSSEKLASCNESSQQLISDYSLYKLAALYRAAASADEFPLTVKLSLRQNQVL